MELDSYFYELFEGLPRQGPGDNESTRSALAMIQPLPNDVRILDIGCGSGTQTIELAGNTSGTITALDNHQPFLDELDRRVSREGLTERIKVVNGSMFSLDFAKESFDVIWSEGAIFIIGFEAGLEAFKPLLKPGGYLAVTDLCWIRDNPPGEIAAFFGTEYPAIMSGAECLESIGRTGYEQAGSFTLPESTWWDSYYRPLETGIKGMRRKYPGNERVEELCRTMERETDMYRKYANYYGYVFFVMRKTG
jgi:cyclopropane fatty-acyl-phospholipid synthase-like methyltransferase